MPYDRTSQTDYTKFLNDWFTKNPNYNMGMTGDYANQLKNKYSQLQSNPQSFGAPAAPMYDTTSLYDKYWKNYQSGYDPTGGAVNPDPKPYDANPGSTNPPPNYWQGQGAAVNTYSLPPATNPTPPAPTGGTDWTALIKQLYGNQQTTTPSQATALGGSPNQTVNPYQPTSGSPNTFGAQPLFSQDTPQGTADLNPPPPIGGEWNFPDVPQADFAKWLWQQVGQDKQRYNAIVSNPNTLTLAVNNQYKQSPEWLTKTTPPTPPVPPAQWNYPDVNKEDFQKWATNTYGPEGFAIRGQGSQGGYDAMIAEYKRQQMAQDAMNQRNLNPFTRMGVDQQKFTTWLQSKMTAPEVAIVLANPDKLQQYLLKYQSDSTGGVTKGHGVNDYPAYIQDRYSSYTPDQIVQEWKKYGQMATDKRDPYIWGFLNAKMRELGYTPGVGSLDSGGDAWKQIANDPLGNFQQQINDLLWRLGGGGKGADSGQFFGFQGKIKMLQDLLNSQNKTAQSNNPFGWNYQAQFTDPTGYYKNAADLLKQGYDPALINKYYDATAGNTSSLMQTAATRAGNMAAGASGGMLNPAAYTSSAYSQALAPLGQALGQNEAERAKSLVTGNQDLYNKLAGNQTDLYSALFGRDQAGVNQTMGQKNYQMQYGGQQFDQANTLMGLGELFSTAKASGWTKDLLDVFGKILGALASSASFGGGGTNSVTMPPRTGGGSVG